MLLVYVDDILLFSESSTMIEHVEEMLEMQFKCSKMGDSQPQLLPGSPLPAPSPYPALTGSLAERLEPESCPTSPVCTISRARRPRPRPVPGTHTMALCPSFVPQRIALPSPSASSLPDVPNPESDLAHAASPTVTRLLATVVTDPSFESTASSALVAELVNFAATRRLEYVASLVTESESVCPPSIRGELALGSNVLEDRQFELECIAAVLPCFTSMLLCLEGDSDALDIPTVRTHVEAIMGEYYSQWQTAMDAEMNSWKSRGTYDDEFPHPRENIIDGIWIFIVKRSPVLRLSLRRLAMSLWRQPQQQQWQRQQHRWPQLQQWRVQLQRLQQPPQRGPDGSGQYTHRYMGAATAIEPCVSSLGLPESLAPLPRSPAPPCTPCIEDRQCAAPHSSSFPPTTAPLETLHLDAWGPSPVLGPCQERYFLIVVDDYSRYTTVLSLRRKADVPTVLEPWLLARGDVHGLCGLRLHSDQGIIRSYTLPDLLQQIGVVERRIGLVMEVARTSMCHASAP
ncbi:unnamed protein product [Closterium sp. NIES-53]